MTTHQGGDVESTASSEDGDAVRNSEPYYRDHR